MTAPFGWTDNEDNSICNEGNITLQAWRADDGTWSAHITLGLQIQVHGRDDIAQHGPERQIAIARGYTTREEAKAAVLGLLLRQASWFAPLVVVARPPGPMSYGATLELILEQGERAARDGWNGRGMWVELQMPDENSKMTQPYLFLCTADGGRVPWTASQTDMLAKDWRHVPRS